MTHQTGRIPFREREQGVASRGRRPGKGIESDRDQH